MSQLLAAATEAARPLGGDRELDALVAELADKRVVLLGAATHGTAEFQSWRARITRRLIDEAGFKFVALECGWPEAHRLHRFATGASGQPFASGAEALRSFARWPAWIWANAELAEFLDGLRARNQEYPEERRVSVHGLDLFSLFESLESVVDYLDQENPFLARAIRHRYSGFDPFLRDEVAYARSSLRYPPVDEAKLLESLELMLKLRIDQVDPTGAELLSARENARAVRDAAAYYRAMLRADVEAWNVRERHMAETLDSLLEFHGAGARGIVWAHNVHVGDHRATDLASEGSQTLGGLARLRHGVGSVRIVGMGTHRGEVTAARAWGAGPEALRIPPARAGSYEFLLHQACAELRCLEIFLTFGRRNRAGPLAEEHGHRAVGVVYQPESESWSNYVPSSIANCYDAFLFCDVTRASKPLRVGHHEHEIPATWPAGT